MLVPEPLIATICKELVSGICHLHSNNLIHRDLKVYFRFQIQIDQLGQLDLVYMFQSDNLLLGMEGQVKITDFGFASKIQASKRKFMRAFQINDYKLSEFL